jgi:hypothetical protein
MALDAQNNWNVEMSQPLRLKPDTYLPAPGSAGPPSSLPTNLTKLSEVLLPIEIIQRIVDHIDCLENDQKTLWACCLVSRAWYSGSIERLYDRPYLRGGNFQAFVATVCPSKNAHIRRSQLSELVKKLDMGELVHDGSKSLTARLLGRLKGNLTSFVAPQASFSVNSFAALSKCTNLTYLNLSLMSASIPLGSLFKTLKALSKLETLFFPRTSISAQETKCDWPPGLKTLHLAGGIDNHFLYQYICILPSSLERLSIQHCPQVYAHALQDTLEVVGPQLRHLTIRHPMNMLQQGVLDHTLMWCPNLSALRVSADFITDSFFDSENIPAGHPLRILDLDCSISAGAEVGVAPDSIWVAIDSGQLSNLRSIRVSSALAWQATKTLRTNVLDLVELLEEREAKEPSGIEPGVWNFP